MPARLRLADHLSEEELFARYQGAPQPLGRTHWQVVWMVSQRFRTEDIADAVGYSPTWIRKLVGRYNEGGPEALGDRRRHNSGAEPLLGEAGEAALRQALQAPLPGGAGAAARGRRRRCPGAIRGAVRLWRAGWASGSAVRWADKEAGRCCAAWATARSARGPAMPRPISRRRPPFREELPGRLADEQRAHPQAEVELWAEDEHRMSTGWVGSPFSA